MFGKRSFEFFQNRSCFGGRGGRSFSEQLADTVIQAAGRHFLALSGKQREFNTVLRVGYFEGC